MTVVTESFSAETPRETYERFARAFNARLKFLQDTGATRLIPWQIRYAQKYIGPVIDDIFDAPQLKEK